MSATGTAREIAALPAGQRPTIHTLRHLFSLQLEIEKKLRDGPWDRWDGELLERWRAEAEEQVRACSIALEFELVDARRAAELRELLERQARWLRIRGFHAEAAALVDAIDDDGTLRIL